VKSRDILAELRAWRDEFARAHGGDIEAMGAALRTLDAAAGARVVHGTPRRPAPVILPESSEPSGASKDGPAIA
jgi:hypothetical protein